MGLVSEKYTAQAPGR